MDSIALGTAEMGTSSDGVRCVAEISFDLNKLAEISAPVGGIIKSVDVDLGSHVKEQQVVSRVWSATIAEAVAKAVLTHQTLERERKLRAQRVTSERDLQQAEAEHRAACQQARTLGFSEEQIDSFGAHPEDPVMLEVRAPFAGEIVERWAVQGALMEPGKPLFKIADRSTMWAMLSIPESALGRVREGQEVELRIDSLPGEIIKGKLTWVDAKVNDCTRMALGRAEVPNPRGVLRANMFAGARIITQEPNEAMLVPDAAVQTVEGRPVVFVKLEDDLYEARVIRAGTRHAGKLEVIEGLDGKEQLVLANSFPLKSQLLISRLGAGCAHE
jgi:cobalt-zinc-cadmium efflux system membrane fusion protein